MSEIQSLFIYPDPVSNQITLQVGIKQGGSWTLLVRDVLGKTLVSKSIQLAAGLNNIINDVSFLPDGTYYVSLRNGKNIATRRFIKSN